jgi:hypothetical protein
MKIRTLLLTLVSIFISFNSYGEWTKVIEADGKSFYIDKDTIKGGGRSVHLWELIDNSKPIRGNMSSKFYNQMDCLQFKFRPLLFTLYKQPMGQGKGKTFTLQSVEVWTEAAPGSALRARLDYACNHVK